MAIDLNAHTPWLRDAPRPLVVGIAGGSGSGKTSIATALSGALGAAAALLQHDSYYRDLTHLDPAAREVHNYDHPEALETALMVEHLDQLRAGRAIARPAYDFSTQARTPQAARIEPRPLILVEGIMVLQDADLRRRLDLKVFVDTSEEDRFSRRLARDQRERGYTAGQIRRQLAETVKPMHDRYVEPSRAHADIIIPNGYNPAAVGILLAALRSLVGSV
jgi:uridine kinase